MVRAYKKWLAWLTIDVRQVLVGLGYGMSGGLGQMWLPGVYVATSLPSLLASMLAHAAMV